MNADMYSRYSVKASCVSFCQFLNVSLLFAGVLAMLLFQGSSVQSNKQFILFRSLCWNRSHADNNSLSNPIAYLPNFFHREHGEEEPLIFPLHLSVEERVLDHYVRVRRMSTLCGAPCGIDLVERR